VQDLFGRKPYWLPGSPFTLLRWLSRSPITRVSSTLLMAGNIETGRYDPGSSRGFPFPLWIGWTSPILNAAGTRPSARLQLTRWEIGPTRTSTPFFSTEVGMPSVPKASVLLRPFIASDVLFAFANLKLKGGDVATGRGVVVGLLQDVVNLLRNVGHFLRDVGCFLRDLDGLLLYMENIPSDVGRLLRQSGE
jgi:hypothetical protein